MRTSCRGIVIKNKEMGERLMRVHQILAVALLRIKTEEQNLLGSAGCVEKKTKNKRA